MMPNKADEFQRRLQHVHDKQIENQHALQNIEQIEHDFSEGNMESRRLVNRIIDVWYCDEEFRMKLQQCQIELDRHSQKTYYEIEEKKQQLAQEKRELFQLEDELSEQILFLNQEDEV